MAKPLMWYKNIKPGDILEVEFLPGHLFFVEGGEWNKQKVLITAVNSQPSYAPNGPAFYGNLFAMGCHCTNQIFVDFNDSDPQWNQVKFLRKIHKGEKK